jgi:hypothetical protein
MLSREFRSLIPDFIRLSSSIFPALDAGSVKRFAVFHLKSFRIEFAINPVMFAVLGDKQLRVARQTHVRAVVVERSRIAMGDGEIRIFLNLNPLLPLPDERRVDLSLFL